MASGLGLDTLSEGLNNAVTSNQTGDSEKIGGALYSVVVGWLTGSVFPVMMTILIFVTILFTFYGSFLYFTAYGDENKAQQAKKTITFAMVGFVIAIVAFSISTYVQRILISKNYEDKNQSQDVNEVQPDPAVGTDPFNGEKLIN